MPRQIKAMELNALLFERLENGVGSLEVLSLVTLVVTFLLLVSYASQVVLPFATGQATVTVDLLDPTLLVFEVILIVLTLAWVYVGAVNLLWSRRICGRIKRARAKKTRC